MPKQYQSIRGRPLLWWTLDRIASHPAVDGLIVVLAADDQRWPGWSSMHGKPLRLATGGAERADSVLAGLLALDAIPDAGPWVMVHDAARPCVLHADIDTLVRRASADPVGAILAGRICDTLKRGAADGRIEATVPRENIWRAYTPQLLRRDLLSRALDAAKAANGPVTDDANALEVMGFSPLLIESSDDNLKVTSGTDLERAERILEAQGAFRGIGNAFSV